MTQTKFRSEISIMALALLGLVFIGGISAPQTQAGSEHNLSEWAWSETIGWVSFNSTNCDPDGDKKSNGTNGCPPAGATVENYGVNVASGGNMSGYAWSEHIGWVSFNETTGCPSAPCQPKLNPGNGEVSGWARALAGGSVGAGGWDGWIHLKGSNYGVTVSGCNWGGYAWGSDVVGWIHFRGSNYGVAGSGNACSALSADLKANNSDGPITIPFNTAANLTWSSSNATSCSSPDFSTDGATSNSTGVSTGNLTASKTYNLTCTRAGGSASDSVTVNVGCPAGQTKPHSICSGGACVSVNACGVTTCSSPAQCALAPFSLTNTGDISATIVGTSPASSNQTTIRVTPLNEFFDAEVNLLLPPSVSPPLPTGAQHIFSDLTLDSSEYSTGSTYHVILPASTPADTYVITIQGRSGVHTSQTSFNLKVNVKPPQFREVFSPFKLWTQNLKILTSFQPASLWPGFSLLSP